MKGFQLKTKKVNLRSFKGKGQRRKRFDLEVESLTDTDADYFLNNPNAESFTRLPLRNEFDLPDSRIAEADIAFVLVIQIRPGVRARMPILRKRVNHGFGRKRDERRPG